MKDKRVAEAEKKARQVFDRILETHAERDFVEIVARVGGDVVVRRYYNNGKEYDR